MDRIEKWEKEETATRRRERERVAAAKVVKHQRKRWNLTDSGVGHNKRSTEIFFFFLCSQRKWRWKTITRNNGDTSAFWLEGNATVSQLWPVLRSSPPTIIKYFFLRTRERERKKKKVIHPWRPLDENEVRWAAWNLFLWSSASRMYRKGEPVAKWFLFYDEKKKKGNLYSVFPLFGYGFRFFWSVVGENWATWKTSFSLRLEDLKWLHCSCLLSPYIL